MEKYNIIFTATEFSSKPLLGKRASEYVVEQCASLCDSPVELEEGKDARPYMKEGYINVVLSLDMPLVRADDIKKFAALIKHKRLGGVRLGGVNSDACIALSPDFDDGIFVKDDAFLKIDSAKSFCMVYNLMKERILDGHLERGVRIIDRATCFCDSTVTIDGGATIMPFTRLEGDTHIASGAEVGASYLCDCKVGAGAKVEMSHLVGSKIGDGATVGPFARLRGANIGRGCRIGDFVEVKASTLGDGVKSAHLTYIGDADVGEGTNIGCGTVFCNYDGKQKRRTSVGKDCFIGANANLVAPLTVGDGCFVAAGTTVTDDVAPRQFVIGRTKQTSTDRKS